MEVVGLPNPKLRPMDVVGVDRAPNVSALVVVVGVPKDVLLKPKPVTGLNEKNNGMRLSIKSFAKNNSLISLQCALNRKKDIYSNFVVIFYILKLILLLF